MHFSATSLSLFSRLAANTTFAPLSAYSSAKHCRHNHSVQMVISAPHRFTAHYTDMDTLNDKTTTLSSDKKNNSSV
jgi:hypothetical protein